MDRHCGPACSGFAYSASRITVPAATGRTSSPKLATTIERPGSAHSLDLSPDFRPQHLQAPGHVPYSELGDHEKFRIEQVEHQGGSAPEQPCALTEEPRRPPVAGPGRG